MNFFSLYILGNLNFFEGKSKIDQIFFPGFISDGALLNYSCTDKNLR